MYGQMPQEIEVWYIIPALRRELAKSMIQNFNLTQKQVAEHIGLTAAAVSQYLSSKRAKDLVFSENVLQEISKSAGKVIQDNKLVVPEMIRLCNITEVKKVMCNIHKNEDVNLPQDCNCCFEEVKT